MTMRQLRSCAAACTLAIAACSGTPATPLETVQQVDLKRYAGEWYVIGHIPPWIEKDSQNSIESYRIEPDGTVAISFTYRNGGEEAKVKRMSLRGFIEDRSNAVWGVQFIWPIKADYRVTYLAPDYSQVIVSREKRDYVWIMARSPSIPDADYSRLVALVERQGYDISRLRKVPQQWR